MRDRVDARERRLTRRQTRAVAISHLGFSQKWIDRVAIHQPHLFDDPEAKLDALRDRGFGNALKLITSQPAILGLSLHNIDAKLRALEEHGFKNPQRIIASQPSIFGLSVETIAAKIEGLEDRGFKDPVKLVTSQPSILGQSLDNLDAKLDGLRALGFNNPVKVITSQPSILGLSLSKIDALLEGLRARGFKDPLKLITSAPTILSYSFTTIGAKLDGLRARGFDDPVKLIASAPATISYSFQNIDRKIRLLSRLHGDRAKALSEITALPTLLSYKWRRLLFAVRLTDADGLRKVILVNPKLLAIAKAQTGSNSPRRLAVAAKFLPAADADRLLGALVEEGRLDLRIVRALRRI